MRCAVTTQAPALLCALTLGRSTSLCLHFSTLPSVKSIVMILKMTSVSPEGVNARANISFLPHFKHTPEMRWVSG